MLRIDAAIGSTGHPSGQPAGRGKGFGGKLVRGFEPSDVWLRGGRGQAAELLRVSWVSSACIVGFVGTNIKLLSG